MFRGELLNFRGVLFIQEYELLCIKVRISSITGGKIKLSKQLYQYVQMHISISMSCFVQESVDHV